MIRLLIPFLLVLCLCVPASAAEFTAPEVPDSGQSLMPDDFRDFGAGAAALLKKACSRIRPDLAEAVKLSKFSRFLSCFAIGRSCIYSAVLQQADGFCDLVAVYKYK